jgi:hypothetical protein
VVPQRRIGPKPNRKTNDYSVNVMARESVVRPTLKQIVDKTNQLGLESSILNV